MDYRTCCSHVVMPGCKDRTAAIGGEQAMHISTMNKAFMCVIYIYNFICVILRV